MLGQLVDRVGPAIAKSASQLTGEKYDVRSWAPPLSLPFSAAQWPASVELLETPAGSQLPLHD